MLLGNACNLTISKTNVWATSVAVKRCVRLIIWAKFLNLSITRKMTLTPLEVGILSMKSILISWQRLILFWKVFWIPLLIERSLNLLKRLNHSRMSRHFSIMTLLRNRLYELRCIMYHKMLPRPDNLPLVSRQQWVITYMRNDMLNVFIIFNLSIQVLLLQNRWNCHWNNKVDTDMLLNNPSTTLFSQTLFAKYLKINFSKQVNHRW